MAYNYSAAQVTKRAGSGGKDAGRMHTIDRLVAQATQPPHEDDAQAVDAIKSLGGIPGGSGFDQAGNPTSGFATADARNYAKLALSRLDPSYSPEYQQANDGSFSLGKTLGGVLKVAAPIAGALIPGVGTLGSLAIGSLGNAGGNLLQGNGFDLKGALLSGAAAAGGNALLGNQGFRGLGGIPQRLGIGGGAPGAVGNATQSMAGAASAAPSAAPGGILAKLGGLGGVAKAGIGAAALLDSRAQRKAAERMANSRLDLYNRQLGLAEQDYQSRAPLRNAALQQLGTLAGRPVRSSIYGAA